MQVLFVRPRCSHTYATGLLLFVCCIAKVELCECGPSCVIFCLQCNTFQDEDFLKKLSKYFPHSGVKKVYRFIINCF